MPNISLPPFLGPIDVVGAAGFVLSVILVFLEIRRRARKLTVKITSVDILGSNGATLFVVLRIAIVNSSSEGKTIGHVRYRMGDKYQIRAVLAEGDPATGLATFAPLGAYGKTKTVQQTQIISYPLDVPAHGSIGFYACVSLFPVSAPPSDRPDLEPRWDTASLVEAVDIAGNVIASTKFPIPVYEAG